MKQKNKICINGLFVGVINGLFGTGGGLIAVPILRKIGLNQKQAQLTSIAIILPLAVISGFYYCNKTKIPWITMGEYWIGGALGSIIGMKIIKNTSNKWLQIIFSIFLLWAGIRMVLK